MSHISELAGSPAEKQADTAKTFSPLSSRELLDVIVSALEEDKAEELVQIDLQGRSEIADYMVICSGRSTRQVSSMADKLIDQLKRDHGRLAKIEGKSQGDWVLIDVGDVIVHIFRPEVRDFYQLEKMWQQPGHESPDNT